jgi:hypothetical protein
MPRVHARTQRYVHGIVKFACCVDEVARTDDVVPLENRPCFVSSYLWQQLSEFLPGPDFEWLFAGNSCGIALAAMSMIIDSLVLVVPTFNRTSPAKKSTCDH